METRYILSAQYMLVDGVGKGDILIYKPDKPYSLRIAKNCIDVYVLTAKLVNSAKEVIKELGYGYDIAESDIDKILKATKNDVTTLPSGTTIARTVSIEIVKNYMEIDKISVLVNANNDDSKMIVICYNGKEKKNEYSIRIYRGDICVCGHNKWNGNYAFQMNDLPQEVKKAIVEKIDSLMKEMDEIKEPIFSLNREYEI